ncbi:hypothetical protein CU100_09930 [Phyllobacterium endophyticum]|uniref:Uncharacterized protein n=2 Tax=Phyllobacterium endophyticum TaxID=1149773 RepID=A0A2P7AUS9_9HYPH|nr:hypothetical protein CU100_09930 [Phyllobacterium endophyticum]
MLGFSLAAGMSSKDFNQQCGQHGIVGMMVRSFERGDPMRTHFEDDPENGRSDPPYFLYGSVFLAALAIAIAIGWFLLHLERVAAYVP